MLSRKEQAVQQGVCVYLILFEVLLVRYGVRQIFDLLSQHLVLTLQIEDIALHTRIGPELLVLVDTLIHERVVFITHVWLTVDASYRWQDRKGDHVIVEMVRSN